MPRRSLLRGQLRPPRHLPAQGQQRPFRGQKFHFVRRGWRGMKQQILSNSAKKFFSADKFEKVMMKKFLKGLPSDFQIVSRICPTPSSGPSPPFCLFSQPHRVEITVQPCAFRVSRKFPTRTLCLPERHLRVRGGILREPLREVFPGGRDRRQGTVC